MHCGYFDTTRKGNTASFLVPTVVGGRRYLPRKICAQIDPPPSKHAHFYRSPLITSQLQKIAKKFSHDEYALDHGLCNELWMWCVRYPYVPKGWLKKRFFVKFCPDSSSIFYLLFRQLPSELDERMNSTKTGHMLLSKCDLKMHVRNLGYTLPLEIGGLKPPLFDDFAT